MLPPGRFWFALTGSLARTNCFADCLLWFWVCSQHWSFGLRLPDYVAISFPPSGRNPIFASRFAGLSETLSYAEQKIGRARRIRTGVIGLKDRDASPLHQRPEKYSRKVTQCAQHSIRRKTCEGATPAMNGRVRPGIVRVATPAELTRMRS